MNIKKRLLALLSLLMMSVFLLTGCSPEDEELLMDLVESESEYDTGTDYEEEAVLPTEMITESPMETDTPSVSEDGEYTSKEEVAAYLHEYGHLPSNFITKKEAQKLGWISNEGNLWEVAPGKSIGGDYFGNYEGILPEKEGRDYHECDIDTEGKYRGSKRIVFSDDGLIYYTEDHYETFECLYGVE